MKIKEITEGFDYLAERKQKEKHRRKTRKKPTKARCVGPGKLSAFDDAHCISMGYKPRKTNKKFNVGGKIVSVRGKKVKGESSGGPIPNYSKDSRDRGHKD